jgi:hypothetical protein
MLDEAMAAGLAVDPAKVALVLGNRDERHAKPDPNAVMHKSLMGWWLLAEVLPKRYYDWASGEERRRMNLGRRRKIPPGALIHRAATLRDGKYQKRLPKDAIIVD